MPPLLPPMGRAASSSSLGGLGASAARGDEAQQAQQQLALQSQIGLQPPVLGDGSSRNSDALGGGSPLALSAEQAQAPPSPPLQQQQLQQQQQGLHQLAQQAFGASSASVRGAAGASRRSSCSYDPWQQQQQQQQQQAHLQAPSAQPPSADAPRSLSSSRAASAACLQHGSWANLAQAALPLQQQQAPAQPPAHRRGASLCTLPARPARGDTAVSLSPSATATLVALGLGPRLAGVTDACCLPGRHGGGAAASGGGGGGGPEVVCYAVAPPQGVSGGGGAGAGRPYYKIDADAIRRMRPALVVVPCSRGEEATAAAAPGGKGGDGGGSGSGGGVLDRAVVQKALERSGVLWPESGAVVLYQNCFTLAEVRASISVHVEQGVLLWCLAGRRERSAQQAGASTAVARSRRCGEGKVGPLFPLVRSHSTHAPHIPTLNPAIWSTLGAGVCGGPRQRGRRP
jgi:hypothetical protein